jgi:fatty-acyl-CoA synthase
VTTDALPSDAYLTIPASLERAAGAGADRGITFVRADGTEVRLSFAEVRARARAVAAALQARGVARGDRVALVLSDAEEFVPAFLGAVEAGAIGVPLSQPAGMAALGPWLERTGRLVAAAGARLLVADGALRPMLGTLAATPGLEAIVGAADLAGDAAAFREPGVTLDDVAMLQYTSGSTAQPKGVTLTHRNLAANCRVITHEGLAIVAEDRAVSWLPLFHDMGLIGFVLAPLYRAVPIVLLPPLRFLKRPALWLQLLSRHRGTISYAPNFAYAYAARRVRDEELEGVDLSHVRVMGCGAEPIQAETLRGFARRFAPWGFRAEAFRPSYGMAESSLAISFASGLRVDRVRRAAFADEARAEAAGPEETDALEFVDCGRPFSGHSLWVVDPESGVSLSERRVGEIRLFGPSVMRGYWENPDATAAAFDGQGRLRTGDLGYLADGRLYVCGRIKDLIIVRGRKYAPQDIEWAAARVDAVRAGCVVAFAAAAADGSGESVVVVAESREAGAPGRIAEAITLRVLQEVGLRPDRVLVVPPHTIPKTSSGKLQRSAVRTRYAEAAALAPPPADGHVRSALRLAASQLAYLRSALVRRWR